MNSLNPTTEKRLAELKAVEFSEHAVIKKFGFWIYLMSDCILFSVLFGTYIVLGANYAGGPTQKSIFNLGFVLAETFLLLASSFACGMTLMIFKNNAINRIKLPVAIGLLLTLLLGIGFLIMEIHEFVRLILAGAGPDRSAFLSAFFTLVGTHGLHVCFGSLWIVVMIFQILVKGRTEETAVRFLRLTMFWHFLDVIWVCVFTIVYLVGMS